jgi:enoyl-CoA hydratase/carnithine racemase
MIDWNFADVWELVASARPEDPALVQAGRKVSWREFEERSDRLGRELAAAGLSSGDKVAQLLYDAPEYVETVFACCKQSLAAVNTNFRYTAGEPAYLWYDADVRAVVFHGCFASRITDQSLDDYHRMIRSTRATYTTIWNTQKLIIAKIRGYCISGGCYIQMLCDVGIASEQATFGHPAVTTGGVSAMPPWNWLLGLRKAKELLLTGKMITVIEAETIGLVNRTLPDDRLDLEVEVEVEQMLSVPLTSLTLYKEGLNTAVDVMGLAATFRTQGHMNALARFGDIDLDFQGLQRKNQAISPNGHPSAQPEEPARTANSYEGAC